MCRATPPDGPGPGFGICRFCRGPTRPGFARCYCCATVARRLGGPPAPVTAAIAYRPGDAAHRMLRRYKDAPVAEARAEHRERVRRLLDAVVGPDGDPLRDRLGSPWDVVVTVPSSTRPAGSPVDEVVAGVPALARDHRPLLRRGTGRLGRLAPSPEGFVVAGGGAAAGLRGARALVVDDTYVTGARAQSAVAALRAAGLRVPGVLVAGLVVDPAAGPWQAAYWAWQARARADAMPRTRLPAA